MRETTNFIILGSLQAHAVKSLVRGGVLALCGDNGLRVAKSYKNL